MAGARVGWAPGHRNQVRAIGLREFAPLRRVTCHKLRVSSLPGAGWYDDGATAGVLLGFDGSTWTERTKPVFLPIPVQAAVTTPTSTFGRLPTGRLGQSLNLADHVSEAMRTSETGSPRRSSSVAGDSHCSAVPSWSSW